MLVHLYIPGGENWEFKSYAEHIDHGEKHFIEGTGITVTSTGKGVR